VPGRIWRCARLLESNERAKDAASFDQAITGELLTVQVRTPEEETVSCELSEDVPLRSLKMKVCTAQDRRVVPEDLYQLLYGGIYMLINLSALIL